MTETLPRRTPLALIYAIAIIAAFAFTLLLIGLLGFDPLRALRTLVTTSFRTGFGFQETIKKAVPLIFTTYAFSIPFMIKFFNIGAWGQMLFGATITAIVGLIIGPLGIPGFFLVPTLLTVGAFSGGGFALVSGWLKARFNVNPIISTIMSNYVALYFLNFVATSAPFRDLNEGHPMTVRLPENALIGNLAGVPLSVVPAIFVVFLVWFLISKTRLGYEIRAVGYNQRTAETYGVKFTATILLTFFVGGALAGFGGAIEVLATQRRLIEGFATTSGAQFGMFGIVTALIVNAHPIAVPFASFLMAVLLVGADALQRTMQVPVEVVFLAQSFMVLFVVVTRERFAGGNR
jgi:ABC-type uncharacterized transport system permease subunit